MSRTSLLNHLFAIILVVAFAQAGGATLPSGFTEATIGGTWNEAVGLTFDADGHRMFVWEKGGRVWIVENDTRLPNPLIDISAEVGNWRDHGMLGFALDRIFNPKLRDL